MIKEKSCGAIVYRFDGNNVLFLIEKMQKGHYSIPKGHVEGDETEVETALREIKEETNLDVIIDTRFREVISYSPYEDCLKDVIFFVGQYQRGELINQEIEVSSLMWLNKEDALKTLTHESDRNVLTKAYTFITDHYCNGISSFIVNNKTYTLKKLLGHGKGGYSYLATCGNEKLVLKKIHHEPCDYYQFGDKIQAEFTDYQRLLDSGIRIPHVRYFDKNQEIVIKEYVNGPTISELVNEGTDVSKYIDQVLEMQVMLKKKDLNIDYYPTNFVIQNDNIYYIDYECNKYDPKWDFDNWGIQYWKAK